MNKLKWNLNQLIWSYSTSLIERIKFQSYYFSRNSLQTEEGCIKLRKEEESWLKVFCSCKITSQVAMATATKCRFAVLSHPSYSLDLAPSVSKSENSSLCGVNFGSNEGIIGAVEEYLCVCMCAFVGEGVWVQGEGFYFERISKLDQHWRKCIETKGDYFPKYRGWEHFDSTSCIQTFLVVFWAFACSIHTTLHYPFFLFLLFLCHSFLFYFFCAL